MPVFFILKASVTNLVSTLVDKDLNQRMIFAYIDISQSVKSIDTLKIPVGFHRLDNVESILQLYF